MLRFGLFSLLACVVSLAVSGPASAAISFTSQNVGVGTGPQGIDEAAFSGPGSAGLAVANVTSGTTSLLTGGPSGFSNASGSPFSGPGGAQDVATGDFNNDGKADVISVGNHALSLRLGDGNGSLGSANAITPAPVWASSVAVGDFDGDGNLDFATSSTDQVPQRIDAYYGNGSGTSFTHVPFIPIGTGTTDLASGDFNNDNLPDLVVTTVTDHKVQVLLSAGAGRTFNPQTAIDLGAGSQPTGVAAADLNTDGNLDAAVANNSGGSAGIFVLLGNGAGGFSNSVTPAQVNGGGTPQAVSAADFDGDGVPDLAVANRTSPGSVTVLLNTGSGTSYSNNGALTAENQTYGVVAADFNEDGNPDIAATNNASSSVSIFMNQPPSASVNPSTINFGSQQVNTQSSSQTVTFTNNGPEVLGPVATITGAQKDDFVRISSRDRCTPDNVFLAPGQSCTVEVAAKPKSTGNKTATLEISAFNLPVTQKVTLNVTGVPPVPVSQSAPQISGNPVVGNVLTCSNGTWSNSPTSFAHQWLRNGNAIPGASNATYQVAEADVGQQLTCRVTASNAGGNSNARTSNAVTPTAATPVISVLTVPRQTIQSVISKGLTFRTACANSCLISANVTGPVPPKKKKRRSRRGRAARTAIVGRVTSSLVGGTTQTLTVKISRAGRSALAKRSAARLQLSVTATDPSGSPSTTRATGVSLKKAKPKKKRKSRR